MKNNVFDLSGLHAVVCGGASGMGREFAISLAENGVEVLVADIQEAKAQEVVKEIMNTGGTAHAVGMDASDYSNVAAMGEEAIRLMGTIDVAVNCVGITGKPKDGERNIDTWTRVLGVNLNGMFSCTEVIGEIMISQKHGHIINIASLNATIVPPKVYPGRAGEYGLVSYSAAKAGVRQMSRTMAVLWAEYGVRVNCISPGFVNTPLTAGAHSNPVIRQRREASIPLGYLADPQDISGTVLFLASHAADYINGAEIFVDGGCACL